MREHRARQREGVTALVPVDGAPVPVDGGPGEVEAALEATLAALEGPDPAVAASARRLARALDASESPNPAVSAELRRHIGQMQADARRMAAEKPKQPGKAAERPASRLDALRQARAAQDARRGRGAR